MAVPPYITVTYDPPLPSDTGAAFSAKAFDTVAKFNPWSTAANGLADYVNDTADDALAAAVAAAAGNLDAAQRETFAGYLVGVSEDAGNPLEAVEIVERPELTQVQVENAASTVMGAVSGERLDQKIVDRFNLTGTAPTYACRAWVNFNGTGTVAIRASGNVSSITDNGTGDYTVNFTTALPDANYAVAARSTSDATGILNPRGAGAAIPRDLTSTSFKILTQSITGSDSLADAELVTIAIFR